MEKLILVLLFVFAIPSMCMAQNESGTFIDFQTHYINPIGSLPPKPKSPIKTPLIYTNDNGLIFIASHPEYILYIKDENETVVYSTVVSESETTVVLPSTLSGNYEIVLVMGNWMFTGWIEL